MVGLHSPWGKIWSIATATGWTVNHILWKVAWVNLQMMLGDAARYQKDEEVKEIENIDDAKDFLKL